MDLFLPTFFKFCYTILVVFILARFLYYPGGGKREYLFTFILLSAIIAELCIMISRVDMSFGFALGIFAIFSLIRYRTAPISPREMTYIFLSVGIAAKNQLTPIDTEYYKYLITDGIILLLAGCAEYYLFRDKTMSKLIIYDNLKLIQPDKQQKLEDDISSRFGIHDIKKIKIGKIDTAKHTVRLQVIFIDKNDTNFIED